MTFNAMKFGMDSCPEQAVPIDYVHTIIVVAISPSSGVYVSFAEIETSSPVTVDWGDGTTSTGTPVQDRTTGKYIVHNMSHTYSSYGTYRISIPDVPVSITLTGDQSRTQYGIWDSVNGFRTAVVGIECLAPHLESIGAYGCSYLISMPGAPVTRHCGRGVEIGDYGFAYCGMVSSFEGMAKSFSSSGVGAFEMCTSLSTLAGMSRFSPVADRSFLGCQSLTSIVGGFSGSETQFGASIFEKCISLLSLAGIPASLQTIGRRAFALCSSLSSISEILGTDVTEYPDYCFYKCSSLGSLEGSSNITRFGAHCFDGGVPVQSFYGTSSALEYCGDYCFANSAFNTFVGCPDSITELGEGCFMGCKYLTATTLISAALETIGPKCFMDCHRVEMDGDKLVAHYGMTDTSGLARTNVTVLPAYCFSGCGALVEMLGLSGIEEVGEYCFSNCVSLKSLSGFPDIGDSASRDMTRFSDKHAKVHTGVFSGCFEPVAPCSDISVTDPVTGQEKIYKKAYNGLIDASRLSSLTKFEVFPDRMFEGCSLLPDLPPMPEKAYFWGDYCFSRCHNMKTLDSMADIPTRTGIAGSMGTGNEQHAWLPKFGRYCFAECSWPKVDGRSTAPSPSTDAYRNDPLNPPAINDGLSRIGGLRVFCDKLEEELLKESEATHSYQTAGVFEYLHPIVVSLLNEQRGTDYAMHEMLRYLFENHYFLFYGTGLSSWGDSVAALALRTDIQSAEGDPGAIAYETVPEFEDDGTFSGHVTVKFLFANVGTTVFDIDEIDVTAGEDPYYPDFDSPTNVFEDDNYRVLYHPSFDPSGSGYVMYALMRVRDSYQFGLAFDVYDKNAEPGQELIGTINIGNTLEIPAVPNGIKNLLDRFRPQYLARSVVSCYHYDSFLATSYGGISISSAIEFVKNLSGAFVDAFHDALLQMRMIGTSDEMFGDHCFYGCEKLSVTFADDNPQKNKNGFPSIASGLSDYCFQNSGVSVNSAFKFVRTIGKGCFAGTPTSDLKDFPKSVSYVPVECFLGCEKITSLGALNNRINAFASSAFEGCVGLVDLAYTGENQASFQDDSSLDFRESFRYQYSEYVDRYYRSRMVESLGARSLKGTPITSLYYEADPLRLTDEYTEQDLVKDLFGDSGPVTVQLIATDSLDSKRYQHFVLRIRAGAWGQNELIYNCTVSGNLVDGDADDQPGFDLDGNDLEDGCIGVVNMYRETASGSTHTPAYSHGQRSPDRRLIYIHSAESTGYFKIGPDGSDVRLGCPADWYPSRTSSSGSHTGTSGNGVWFFIGPYRIHVSFCFGVKSKTVEAVGSNNYLREIEYEIKGLRVDSCDMIHDVGESGKDRVPIFPLVTSVGAGCFEGCTLLSSLDGFPSKVSDLPSRCFAGCPFEHDVEEPEVITPSMTFEMPVLTSRLDWQKKLNNALYLRLESVWDSSSSTYTGVKISNKSYGTYKTILADLTHVQDPDTGEWSETLELNSESDTQLDPVEVWTGSAYEYYTPTLESLDHDYIVLRLTPDVTIRCEFSWSGYGNTRAPYLNGTRTIYDSVADEMRVYLDGCGGSVVAGEFNDFLFDNPHAVDENGDDLSFPLITFDWDRRTGEWRILMYISGLDPNAPTFYIRGTGGAKSVKNLGTSGSIEDGTGYFRFQCHEHTDWEVWAYTLAPAVQVLECSVDIPPTVTSVGKDCFSFKDYPEAEKVLQGVYFHTSAAAVRRMSGFPFGVPPGCSIYANGGIIYTEPLPPSQ